MERKMMEGIEARAEGRPVSDAADDAQVALWVATLVAFVASAGMVLAGRRWRQRIATFVGAGSLFQFLTFVQPSLLVGALLVVVLCAAVWIPLRA
jgi:hypothetical protein